MAFKKRESAALNAAHTRSSQLKAIKPDGTLDLGNGHTHAAYEAQIATTTTDLENYNQALATAGKFGNILKASERKLRKESSAMLKGVGQKYGTDSDEYEQAGGTRDSERKRPVKKPKDALKG